MNEPHLLAALAEIARTERYVPRTRHLDPDGRPTFTNHLIRESSPYLRQHAHNPVDWRPWGPEAFALARQRDVPILLSVGYSTCHWCHVMEHESFEDLEIAALVNAHYVPVKVDREERPDVDACYMEVVQAMNGGGGGWPMTVFLTPDGAPLFAGTYFPARDGDRGFRPGFQTLLLAIAERWRAPEFAEQGRSLLQALASQSNSKAGTSLPDEAALTAAIAAFRRSFDAEHGGFGNAPKFPRPAVLDYLLRMARRTGDATCTEMVETTLTHMACGGMYDHVAGGFARYSTDRCWLVPHFEKMLYDNAQLVVSYLEAWQATGRSFYAWVARDTLAWMGREMSDPKGGFWSATDADSEGEEGRFFVWTTAEIEAALPPLDARWVKETFDVTKAGNWDGTNILNLRKPLSGQDLARWERVRAQLWEVRDKRVHPGLDDKVLTAWNGLAISTFARAGVVLGDTALVTRAVQAARFVFEGLVDPERPGRLLRAWRAGRAQHPGVLEDYAAMIGACLDLVEATGDASWLERAVALQRTQDDLFADPAEGGYFRSARDVDPLPIREKPQYDGAEPSGNALAAQNLLRLHEITGEAAWRAAGEATIRALDRLVRHAPTTLPKLLCALDFALSEVKQIVLMGTPAATAPLRDVLRERFVPNAVVLEAPPGAPITRLPLFEGREAPEGTAAAYVCTGMRCLAPAYNPTELRERL